jgi:hypothetical protein
VKTEENTTESGKTSRNMDPLESLGVGTGRSQQCRESNELANAV